MTELSLTEVDLEEVLHRLTVYARNLITASTCRSGEEVVLPGGDSPQDLASAILLKFLDPQDPSVAWRERLGPPTTAGLVIFLRVVLERDFLNLLRSKRYRAALYPDSVEAILRLQLERDGYNAFTNLELARMLAVSVTEIENRKRRLKTRLKNLAAGHWTKGAKHD